VLIAIGGLFGLLACGLIVVMVKTLRMEAVLPLLIFSAVGLVCLVVGSLGSDRAVAKIWGNTQAKKTSG